MQSSRRNFWYACVVLSGMFLLIGMMAPAFTGVWVFPALFGIFAVLTEIAGQLGYIIVVLNSMYVRKEREYGTFMEAERVSVD